MLKALSESLGNVMTNTFDNVKEDRLIPIEDPLTQEERLILFLHRTGKLRNTQPKKKKKRKKK